MTTGPHREWDGARNLADLGGLPLSGGGWTRYGRVWRSAATEWLTTDGWRAARAAGLRRVVDLRNDVERGRRPEHPIVDGTSLGGVEVVNTPTEDPEDPDFLAECGPWLDHPRSWGPNLARYPGKLARVFAAIADADGPVLIHCAGGRDRTGMVCSMLLSLTGVEPGAIAAGYERGFRGAAAHQGHAMAYDPVAGAWVNEAGPELGSRDVDEAVAARLPVLHDWLTVTDVSDYLRGAGLDEERLARLQNLLRP